VCQVDEAFRVHFDQSTDAQWTERGALFKLQVSGEFEVILVAVAAGSRGEALYVIAGSHKQRTSIKTPCNCVNQSIKVPEAEHLHTADLYVYQSIYSSLPYLPVLGLTITSNKSEHHCL
jgi:hypothetical protein